MLASFHKVPFDYRRCETQASKIALYKYFELIALLGASTDHGDNLGIECLNFRQIYLWIIDGILVEKAIFYFKGSAILLPIFPSASRWFCLFSSAPFWHDLVTRHGVQDDFFGPRTGLLFGFFISSAPTDPSRHSSRGARSARVTLQQLPFCRVIHSAISRSSSRPHRDSSIAPR